MSATTVQEAVLAAREAHQALVNLKNLAEQAADKIYGAEIEAVGFAARRIHKENALGTLRAAAQSLQSLGIEAAVAEARAKTNRVLSAVG
jgi:predicted DNA-binding transcriptional regulator YafY